MADVLPGRQLKRGLSYYFRRKILVGIAGYPAEYRFEFYLRIGAVAGFFGETGMAF